METPSPNENQTVFLTSQVIQVLNDTWLYWRLKLVSHRPPQTPGARPSSDLVRPRRRPVPSPVPPGERAIAPPLGEGRAKKVRVRAAKRAAKRGPRSSGKVDDGGK